MSRAEWEGDLSGLLARCRKGDARAWRELVDRFQAFVFSVPKRMGLGDEDASDVFQATFLALHRSLDRVESAAAIPKWLAVTAARESLRIRRVNTKFPAARPGDSDERGLEDLVADEEQSAEQLAVTACDADVVRRGVASLNERCAKLLAALYFEEDLSYQDVSARVGIPVGAIGPTRARCLEKLRRNLAEEGFFD